MEQQYIKAFVFIYTVCREVCREAVYKGICVRHFYRKKTKVRLQAFLIRTSVKVYLQNDLNCQVLKYYEISYKLSETKDFYGTKFPKTFPLCMVIKYIKMISVYSFSG